MATDEQEREAKIAEIDRNLEAFLKVLPDIVQQHRGKHALLHAGEIIEYFPSALDAQIAGNQKYRPTEFSIQHVENRPADLGFYSYAYHPRRS